MKECVICGGKLGTKRHVYCGRSCRLIGEYRRTKNRPDPMWRPKSVAFWEEFDRLLRKRYLQVPQSVKRDVKVKKRLR